MVDINFILSDDKKQVGIGIENICFFSKEEIESKIKTLEESLKFWESALSKLG